MKLICTVCFILKEDQILLGLKKRGFGAGRWNGFGGKVQPNETIEQAAFRETLEESGLRVSNLHQLATLFFDFNYQDKRIETHVFVTHDFSGHLQEGEEMRPRWFKVTEIPYQQMWSDDIYWFPLMLAGKNFEGRFLFDEQDQVLEHHLQEI